MTENELLGLLMDRRPKSPTNDIYVDVGDDAACFDVDPDKSLVVSCDTMVEEVHFTKDTMSCDAIGYKLLASNISDITSMGALPRYALVSICVPDAWSMNSISGIYDGLYSLANVHNICVIGGDTVKSPKHLSLSLTLFGEVNKGRALKRSDAKEGDVVFVSGKLGSSAAGLDILTNNKNYISKFKDLVRGHQYPIPEVEKGIELIESNCRVCLTDISDGLVSEANELSDKSGVKLVLDKKYLPYSKSLFNYTSLFGDECNLFDFVLYGGEDYRLLGTMNKEDFKNRAFASIFHEIGWVERGTGVELVNNGVRTIIETFGYDHFRDR